MSYFDGLVNASFKKRDDGQTIFYPFGVIGSGYVLSEDSERKIRAFLKWYTKICLTSVILVLIISRYYVIFLLPIFFAVYLFKIHHFLSGATRIPGRMTIAEYSKNMAYSMGLPMCVMLLVLGLLAFFASFICLFIPRGRWAGLLGVVFFGACLAQSIFMVRYCVQKKCS